MHCCCDLQQLSSRDAGVTFVTRLRQVTDEADLSRPAEYC
jgi:hypothetical protein